MIMRRYTIKNYSKSASRTKRKVKYRLMKGRIKR